MTPWGYIMLGLGLGLFGGIASTIVQQQDTWLLLATIALLVASALLTLIGAIGEGVRIGNRESE